MSFKRELITSALVLVLIWTDLVTPDLDSQQKDHHEISKRNRTVASCIWGPKPVNSPYARTSCMKVLTKAIRDSVGASNSSGVPQRWMFFGDSTVASLFKYSPLADHFMNQERVNGACPGLYACQTRKHTRCNLNSAFNLPPIENWIPPNFTLGEGPEWYGLEHPNCQDCSFCSSYYTMCKPTIDSMQPIPTVPRTCYESAYHGLYWGMEFSRDVEIQSQQFHTSQENIADFIQKNVILDNHPLHQQVLGGNPICVVSMGVHDLAVPGTTLEVITHNMKWLFQSILAKLCTHIVWVPNAAPLSKKPGKWRQTEDLMAQVNEVVANLLPDLVGVTSSILDVWDASLGYPHAGGYDNIHLIPDWYRALGSFYIELSKELIPTKTTQPSITGPTTVG